MQNLLVVIIVALMGCSVPVLAAPAGSLQDLLCTEPVLYNRTTWLTTFSAVYGGIIDSEVQVGNITAADAVSLKRAVSENLIAEFAQVPSCSSDNKTEVAQTSEPPNPLKAGGSQENPSKNLEKKTVRQVPDIRLNTVCYGAKTCYDTCPICRDRDAICTMANDGSFCALVSVEAATAAALCSKLSDPRAIGSCVKLFAASSATCSVIFNGRCKGFKNACDTCSQVNGQACGASRCCPGETGTTCGSLPGAGECCCCPLCQSPQGEDCTCLPAAC